MWAYTNALHHIRGANTSLYMRNFARATLTVSEDVQEFSVSIKLQRMYWELNFLCIIFLLRYNSVGKLRQSESSKFFNGVRTFETSALHSWMGLKVETLPCLSRVVP